MTTNRIEEIQAGLLDDLRDGISFRSEQIADTLAAMVGDQACDRPRDGELLTRRLGLNGVRPETLTLLGARFELSRDRVRQLYTRAAGQLIRRVQATGYPDPAIFAEQYPAEAGDQHLIRTLLIETYVGDSDIAAQDLAYLKLRLAGHSLIDAKRVAGFVFQRIAVWQQRGRWHPDRPRTSEPTAGQLLPLLRRAQWPGGNPAALPELPITTVDADDDARGRIFAEKLGREATFDTALQARLLRLLDESEQVDSYVERPIAVDYELDGVPDSYCPTIAVRLTDGRVLLVDVVALGQLGLHANRVRLEAARAHAHARGWGLLVFTGSRLGEPDLLQHTVSARSENILRNRLATGPLDWSGFRACVDGTDLEPVDLIALVLRHHWRWDRAPFRLAAS
ncbi:hypothetical protein [Nocardia spumae]|uniref:hypothetical protein n=1 Tax=Nocardia spumae TaxID=2887190 RepID=UPI001D1346A7|nr:hypothetical protein [Nocardia spumae]